MAKLYFKYGAMGSSKSAQALMTKFNYEEKAQVISPQDDIYEMFGEKCRDADVVISDESQFFTEDQIDQLRRIVDECDIPVLCFGLRTDFLTHVFPGSRRLFEVADSITEIKTICRCGRKATVNARIGEDGQVVTSGSQVLLGGNDRYEAMCHRCWKERIARESAEK